MKSYKCIIIDDEQLAIDVINNHFSAFPEFVVLQTFLKPKEALKFLNENEVDLVFTDIAMPNISGMELIDIYNGQAKFIVTTSYSKYAIQSFDLDVIDYLLKPISLDRFAKSLERFKISISEVVSQDDISFIKVGDDYVRLHVDEITYIEGMGDYAKIHKKQGYHLVLKTLKSLEELFSKNAFLRVHKSFVVPTRKIEKYAHGHLHINETQIPVGPAYRESVRSFLDSNQF